MPEPPRDLIRYARTLLILGRVSNLPTVWSNCLAGWWVSGGGAPERFFLLGLGATFLYLAGMFLNDAFDAEFDRQHRPERPIPSGAISAASVWQWGSSWMVLGWLCFGLLGQGALLWALALSAGIVLYDAIHKIVALAPVLMAGCRLLLVLTAASVSHAGISGYSLWVALVLGSYIVGLSFLARKEALTSSALHYWPCLFLAAPVVLALVVNCGPDLWPGRILSLVVVLWVVQSLRHAYWTYQRHVGRAIGGLLAGIVLVDLLAVGGGSMGSVLVFTGLFLLALGFQRFIPPT